MIAQVCCKFTDHVNDFWIGDSGATTHMTRNADLMYDTRPLFGHRSRTILGDCSIKKVQFVGNLDVVFHSRTDHPATLHEVSFVPDLGFNLFLFYVVQEKHEIILNKTGSHLLDGRLVFPRRSNGSSLRATRVLPEGHASASTALAIFVDPASHRSDGPPSPVQYSSVTPPFAHEISRVSSSCRTSNAGAGNGRKSSDASWGQVEKAESVLRGDGGMAAAVPSPGGLFVNKKNKKTY